MVCHDTTVMTYAAYLRVYEPVTAFHEPDRSRWSAYAASPARPRRRDALAAEHVEALGRMLAVPPVPVPERESQHAYIRRVDGIVYVCPWQTRLRSLLASGRLLSCEHPAARPHIRSSAWTVPLAWFVPFAGAERWTALGRAARVQRGADPMTRPALPASAAAATAARALVYATPMSRARRRVARGLTVLRAISGEVRGSGLPRTATAEPGNLRHPHRPGDPDAREREELLDPRTEADLADVGRWLELFHPYSLVELDYGGLVYLFSDHALRRDESAAEVGAAIDAAARGQQELALAMYARLRARWRAFSEFALVN
jgi:hypothetical protein